MALNILVCGSANVDSFINVEYVPRAGETVTGAMSCDEVMLPGGKGANQAVAAARLGATVWMSCRTGNDEAGMLMQRVFDVERVKLKPLSRKIESGPTGRALILSLPDGDNSIIVIPGANDLEWDEKWRQQIFTFFDTRSIHAVLLQREIPDRVNEIVAAEARKRGVPVLLDMGGRVDPPSDTLLSTVSILSPNESELQRLIKDSPEVDARNHEEVIQHVKRLQRERGIASVLVKLGSYGAVFVDKDGETAAKVDAQPCKVCDTTGAGDTFTAAFAVAYLLREYSIDEALLFAATAASLCVERRGAIQSLPSSEEVEDRQNSLKNGKKHIFDSLSHTNGTFK